MSVHAIDVARCEKPRKYVRTGWWLTPLAFWVQQPVYAAGSEF